jgi:phosphate:Na+ symporter
MVKGKGGEDLLEAAIITLLVSICIYRMEPLRGLLEQVVTRASNSKSAVSIIIIGLVAGKAPTISESLGDLFDITITTNINMEFITLDVEVLSIQMTSIGAILFGVKKENIRQTGLAVFGLAVGVGAIFGHVTLASVMGEMEWLSSISSFLNDHLVYAAIVGAFIRSRKIALGVAVMLLVVGLIKLDTAFVVFLGAYIRMLIESRYNGQL